MGSDIDEESRVRTIGSAREVVREAVQVFKDDYHKFRAMPGVGPTRLVRTA